MLAGPLATVALIAGWVTTEVGRQPWVVYRVMPTTAAVTGAGGIPVGYGALVVIYLALAGAVAWILRRLARAPLPEAHAGARRRSPGPAPTAGRRSDRMLHALPLVFVLAGLVLYVVLAGADFGAGIWLLSSGRGERGERIREHAHHSMAPVWEANHVWLIFVLTVTWTAYPAFFGSIASTLAAPLCCWPGSGSSCGAPPTPCAPGTDGRRELRRVDRAFALASLVTPFALGAAAGAIASERVPVGNAAGRLFTSWLNPTSVADRRAGGAVSAYLAAVFLAADAARIGHAELADGVPPRGRWRRDGGRRACARGPGRPRTGRPLALRRAAARRRARGDGRLRARRRWPRWPRRPRRFEPARVSAALAVAAVIVGWALARYPPAAGTHVDRPPRRTTPW